MIIVKTKNGDRFINDKAVRMVEHDREKAEVNAFGDEGWYSHIEDVDGVLYTNDAQPTSWKDEGSEIQRLKAVIEKKEKEMSQTYEHFAYIRDWFFIFQNAFVDIKSAVFRSKNGSKCEDSVINAIIDEAEKKFEESEKRFKEVRAKWDK
jgi:hypothetical protein